MPQKNDLHATFRKILGFSDQYSVMVLEALQKFHVKLTRTPPNSLSDDQYEALLYEYEIIPMRLM